MTETNYWATRIGRRGLLRTGAIGGLGIAGAALIGCGGSDDETATSTPAVGAPSGTAAAGATTAPTTAMEPQSGGTAVFATAGEPPALDPSATLSYGLHTSISPVYSLLVRTVFAPEASSPADFTLKPDLASEWETPDLSTFTFKLDPKAKWHNVAPVNGRAVDSEDIKVVIEHYRDQGAQSVAFDIVDSVETPDAQTVVMKMKTPFALFLETVSNAVRQMFPREVLDREGGLEAEPVIGSGPFVYDHYQRGDGFGGKRNPEYFKDGLPYLDGYEIRYIPDAAARIAAFRAGQLHYLGLSTFDSAETVRKTRPDALYDESIASHSVFLPAMNLNTEPFSDIRVRRAMALATDREGTIASLFQGHGIKGWGVPWVFAQSEPWSDEQLGPWYKFDPAEAKKLMAAAGLEDGFKTSLRYFAYSESMGSQIQLYQAEMKANLGIDIELAPMEYASWFDTFTAHKWDGMAWGFQIGTSASTDDFAYKNLHSKSSSNHYYVNDPKIDELAESIRAEPDEAARRDMVRQIFEIDVDQIYRQPSPYPNGHALIDPKFHGAQPPLQFRSISTYGSAGLGVSWLSA